MSQLIEKARTREDRKKSPGRDESGRDRSGSRRSRKSPDNEKTRTKTPPGHSAGGKVRSLYRSLKGSSGDADAAAVEQEKNDSHQQQQSHSKGE